MSASRTVASASRAVRAATRRPEGVPHQPAAAARGGRVPARARAPDPHAQELPLRAPHRARAAVLCRRDRAVPGVAQRAPVVPRPPRTPGLHWHLRALGPWERVGRARERVWCWRPRGAPRGPHPPHWPRAARRPQVGSRPRAAMGP
ncbi:hypothetical protein VHUM_00542 [Vanrija humicola]|uniref:Uncharacterized protein n=1 Tax=Vanrija humicola TaxID=5417 RepID=A0A7D8Z4H7_VANHU|nr:hypothetical protein VHUM_00542 [Vanrija humicola]